MQFEKYKHITTVDNLKRYFHEIIRSFYFDYIYYVQGEFNELKAPLILDKLNEFYKINLDSQERYHRYNVEKLDVTRIIILHDTYNKKYMYTLLTRKNPEQKYTGIFFEREKFLDATNKKQRFTHNQMYEIRRINKEEYQYHNKKIRAENGIWTVGIAQIELERLWTKFNKALHANNKQDLRQVYYALSKWLGFHQVRKDYVEFKKKLDQRLYKFTTSRGKAMTSKEIFPLEDIKKPVKF